MPALFLNIHATLYLPAAAADPENREFLPLFRTLWEENQNEYVAGDTMPDWLWNEDAVPPDPDEVENVMEILITAHVIGEAHLYKALLDRIIIAGSDYPDDRETSLFRYLRHVGVSDGDITRLAGQLENPDYLFSYVHCERDYS